MNRLQRIQPITEDRWARLPFLIPLSVVIEWTGLMKRDVAELVARGHIRRVSVGGGKGKYVRADVERIIWPDQRRSGPIGSDRPRGPCHPADTGPRSPMA